MKDLQRQLRIEQFNDIELLKAQLWKAAMGETGMIRTVTVQGDPTEVVDENAFDEHINERLRSRT